MNFDIVIYISRNSLSFYFSQNKGEYKVYEFENEPLIPLYFYSEESKFNIGYSAKLKFQRSFPKTYFDYFNLIKDTDSSFKFFNKEKKHKDLLLLGIEYLINHFLRDILMSSDNIADIREKINLNLVFASDIMQNEINFVGELFIAAKYKNLKLIYYNYLLLNFLDKYRRIGAYKDDQGKIGAYKGYLLIDGLDNNLYIDFYNELSSKTPKFNKIGEDLANDPKIKIIAKMLFDLAVLKSGSLVKEKDEISRLLPLAKKYSNTTKSEPLIIVELSDGSIEKVRLKMKKVKEVLSYEANFTKDFDVVKECEQKAKVATLDLLIVIKKSITSLNFLDKIKSYYNKFYHCNEEIEEIFELFITSPDVISIGDFLNTKSLITTSPNFPTKLPNRIESLNPLKTKDMNSEIPSASKLINSHNGSIPHITIVPKLSDPQPLGPNSPPPLPPMRPKGNKKPKSLGPLPPPPMRPKGNNMSETNEDSGTKPPPPPPFPTRAKENKKSEPNRISGPKPPPPPPPIRTKGNKSSKLKGSGPKPPPPPPPRPSNKKRK